MHLDSIEPLVRSHIYMYLSKFHLHYSSANKQHIN